MSSLYTIPFSSETAPITEDPALDCFIGDEQNQLLHRVLQRDVEGFFDAVPISLVGPAGCGKTRLARLIAARLVQRLFPDSECVEFTGVDFARQFRSAELTNGLADWNHSLDMSPVLFIDDLHLIENDTCVEQFSSIVDRRQKKGLATIITSRMDPWEYDKRFSRLASRLTGGLVINVPLPGVLARREMICRLCKKHGIGLGDSVARRLSEQLPPSLPQIQQFVIDLRCRMESAGLDEIPDLDTFSTLFEAVSDNRQSAARLVMRLVAKEFDFPIATLTSSSRRQALVLARSVAVHLLRQTVGLSLQETARFIGRSDHSTVIHAQRKIDAELGRNAALNRRVATLRSDLVGQMQKSNPLFTVAS